MLNIVRVQNSIYILSANTQNTQLTRLPVYCLNWLVFCFVVLPRVGVKLLYACAYKRLVNHTNLVRVSCELINDYHLPGAPRASPLERHTRELLCPQGNKTQRTRSRPNTRDEYASSTGHKQHRWCLFPSVNCAASYLSIMYAVIVFEYKCIMYRIYSMHTEWLALLQYAK